MNKRWEFPATKEFGSKPSCKRRPVQNSALQVSRGYILYAPTGCYCLFFLRCSLHRFGLFPSFVRRISVVVCDDVAPLRPADFCLLRYLI